MLPSSDKNFAILILLLFGLTYISTFFPLFAPWVGFAIAGYSVIANDSIQTLGTFLSSQKRLSWLQIWFFLGTFMLATFIYGLLTHSHDLSFGRLDKIPYPETMPFTLLASPIILLVLTKYCIPVSTTFLLLAAFTHAHIVKLMLLKTLLGYGVAFIVGFIVWLAAGYFVKKYAAKDYNQRVWSYAQYFSTAFLWSLWIMHDMANVLVYLPRQYGNVTIFVVLAYLVLILGVLMYFRGGSIQSIVQEKSATRNVRGATVIDCIFAFMLLVFKKLNSLPMSTTWVFLGLLAGREIALNLTKSAQSDYKKIILKDFSRAALGLLISFSVAYFV